MTQAIVPLVNERACADALGLSVQWVRKDRTQDRAIPFVRFPSGAIRYNLQSVFAAIAALEQGGRAPRLSSIEQVTAAIVARDAQDAAA